MGNSAKVSQGLNEKAKIIISKQIVIPINLSELPIIMPIDKKIEEIIMPSLDCATDKFIQKYSRKSINTKYLFFTVGIDERKIRYKPVPADTPCIKTKYCHQSKKELGSVP